MRTNIVIDDKLMADTLRATGLKTKREAVELGLRTLLRLRQRKRGLKAALPFRSAMSTIC
ncbi:MAG: type II toxin-antitoxin system VapB family antitoxin [Burkholderiaceae bacterium]|nr:type II toxin-antitoxin system VapB family antitoxin [Aquabacterium sp.]NUP88080.1 type II toxin-antitoxin system VapB family antitoxin [Burkholderiaceae bacterium]